MRDYYNFFFFLADCLKVYVCGNIKINKKKKYKSRTQYKLIHHDENNEAFLQLYKEIHR